MSMEDCHSKPHEKLHSQQNQDQEGGMKEIPGEQIKYQ
jgi:hypothetical protein